jgi:hypothetical protein
MHAAATSARGAQGVTVARCLAHADTTQEGDFTKWFNLAAWLTSFVRLQQVRTVARGVRVVALVAG